MAKDRINRDELADKLVERAAEAEDPLRTMAELITGFLMEAEVASQVGAEAHERTEQRTTHRNGYRDRRWDTRLGTMQLQVPKVREGGYVPSFIEHRKRSEQALISVIQEAVVKGVSTRKIEAVLGELGIAGVSAGQVSQLCAALDEKVRKFREGPLGEIRYVWVDALYEKVNATDVLVFSGGLFIGDFTIIHDSPMKYEIWLGSSPVGTYNANGAGAFLASFCPDGIKDFIRPRAPTPRSGSTKAQPANVSVPAPSGTAAGFFAYGDFNGDGIPDVASSHSGDVTVDLHQSGGNVLSSTTYTVSSSTTGAIIAADFNGDGILDLA